MKRAKVIEVAKSAVPEKGKLAQVVLVVVAALLIGLGYQVVGAVGAHVQLTRQLVMWAQQQQQIQLEAAKRQGLMKEGGGADNQTDQGVDGGTAPRR